MDGSVKRLGILTGGGDAPGLNAVIRAVVKAASRVGVTTVGLEDGFDGLLHPERARPLTLEDVTGIQRMGGTILGTTNRGNPLAKDGVRDVEAGAYAAQCLENFRALSLDGLIAVGGDGTLAIASGLYDRGLPVIGVPKTIDNDIAETTLTVGFDSAVAFATAAVDRLHTTAEAHHRVMVVEVMGRYAGWIAVHAGIAGGADVILIPEIPFQIEAIAERIRQREAFGARWTIIVAAEGAFPAGGRRSIAAAGAMGREERLGGIAEWVAGELERLTGKESRFDVLGHLQRGGTPTSGDRVAAARFGACAVELATRGEFGVMLAFQPPDVVTVPLARIAGRANPVPVDGDLVRAARNIGISFGE